MKNTIISMISCSLFLISSCTTVTKTATTVNVDNNITTYPTVADLDVQSKTTQSMTWNFTPFHWGEPKLSTARGNLIHEILKTNNADILLEAQFKFEKTAYGQRTLTVTGLPATYKNFRKATDKDLDAIKACKMPNERTDYNKGEGGLLKIFKK